MTVMLKSGTAYAQSKIRKAERAKLVDRGACGQFDRDDGKALNE